MKRLPIQLLIATLFLVVFVGCSSKTIVINNGIIYEKSHWKDLENYSDEDFRNVKKAFLRSCEKLNDRQQWKEICNTLPIVPDEESYLREFFQAHFEPFLLVNSNEENQGLITGYYQPLLKGSFTQDDKYRYPLYKPPANSIVRSNGKRMRFYKGKERECLKREQIDSEKVPLKGNELLWVDNKIDSFFLQIQGSGLVELDNKEIISVGYAGKNSHKYVAIGKVLVERGEMEMEKVSMQSIREWLENNPSRQDEILNENPSYVFFNTIDSIEPYGAFGVPLTPKRSIAVDKEYVPFGYPMYIATHNHLGDDINRVVFAQDIGGAIKGRVRADIYFGFGRDAEFLAGHMKGYGKIWVFFPKKSSFVELTKIKEKKDES